MDVVLHLLHEGLLCMEQRAERLSEGVLRALLFAAMIVLACVHPVVGILVVCAALLRYGPVALAGKEDERFLAELHHSSIHEVKAAEAALRAAQDRIQGLERDLAIARAEQSGRSFEPNHHAVGLHDGAPDWVVECVRRAYRLRLHPDRHPEKHKQAAHDRFVAAEAKFDIIYRQRGIGG